ncbi:HAD family hydrolase [Marinicrinis lubricantis]|uniref:HAD family hydrolase n=1 Tax=Marinicrinis lubricantis TaxID=2086470 RepID=A0ABW1IVN2_9BACL
MSLSICFDMDDTLYDQQLPFRKAVMLRLPDFPEREIGQLFVKVREYSDELWIPHSQGKLDLNQLRIQRILFALREWDIQVLEGEATAIQSQYELEQRRIQLYPEVSALLGSLNKLEHVDIGLITNGPVMHQMNKISALGIDSFFPPDYVFISDAVGLAKPNPDIFRHVEQRMGYPLRKLYIGDAWHNDVLPSLEAGWDCIWFNPRHLPKPCGASPYVAHSWDEIVRLVEQYMLQNGISIST